MVFSTLLFFLYLWGFGYSVMKISRAPEATHGIERNVMRLGIGMGVLLLLAMIFNVLHIPLDWRIFLVLALAGPLYYTIRTPPKATRIVLRTHDLYLIVVALIVIVNFYTYLSGAFAYPYLENDDSWSHATGSKFISIEKTFDEPPGRAFQYMNPYPPSYDFIMGLMHQVTDDLHWTLKFYNALLTSMGILLFYFFAKQFLGSPLKGVIATLILASVPAYLSHFIWAPVLAMFMFYPSLYALEKISQDKRWIGPAIAALGGLLVAHPTHTLTLYGLIGLYVIVKTVALKNMHYLTAYTGGIAASLSWWALHGYDFATSLMSGSGIDKIVEAEAAQGEGILHRIISALTSSLFSPTSGTASRAYTFNDFFVTQSQNLINNPLGIGQVAFTLFLASLVVAPALTLKRLGGYRYLYALVSGTIMALFTIAIPSKALLFIGLYALLNLALIFAAGGWKKNTTLTISLMWFIVTFFIVNCLTFNLPVGFFAFRTWMILVVPMALITAIGAVAMHKLLRKLPAEKNTLVLTTFVIGIVLLFGLYQTSWQQKYDVNTAQWPPGAFWSSEGDILAHLWLRQNLEPNTRVFGFTDEDQIIGMGMMMCGWCDADATYRDNNINDTASEFHAWLTEHEYEYVVVTARDVNKHGQETIQNKLNEMGESGLFGVAWQGNGGLVLTVT